MYIDYIFDIPSFILSNNISLLVVSNPIYDKLLLQNLVREINGKELTFLSLRNIIVHKPYRNQGYFRQIIESLERKKIPVMVDDIINKKVSDYLSNRGWIPYTYIKNNKSIFCYINNTPHRP